MLSLTRKDGEKVIIEIPASTTPTKIEVKVRDIGRGRARLYFDAPRTIRIDREEIVLARASEGGA